MDSRSQLPGKIAFFTCAFVTSWTVVLTTHGGGVLPLIQVQSNSANSEYYVSHDPLDQSDEVILGFVEAAGLVTCRLLLVSSLIEYTFGYPNGHPKVRPPDCV